MPTHHIRPTLHIKRSALVLAVASLALLATPAIAGDLVLTKSGWQGNRKASDPPTADDYAGSNFTVVREDIDFIYYTIPGVADEQRISMDKVIEIYHEPANTPRGLARGERLVDNAQWADAAAELEDVIAGSTTPAWAKAKAAYLLGVAHAGAGDHANAAKLLDGFLSTYSKSRYIPRVTMELARSHVATGAYDKAGATFKRLSAMKGLSEADKIEAQYGSAWLDQQIAEARKDTAGLESALKGYESLLTKIRTNKNMKDLVGKCTIGKASCLVGLGRSAEAKTLCEKAIKTSKDEFVRAGAYTMLGRVMVQGAAAGGGGDIKVYQEALLHFLRVVTLYGSAPGAEEYMAESMYTAGELFYELRPTKSDSQADKDQARTYRSYARREWRECAMRYPNSPWGRKAAQKVN